jgi:GNAT superfamily N-acetyltransferase
VSNSLAVRRAQSPEEKREALEIRRRVFVLEQGIAESDDRDGLDEDALHVLAFEGSTPAGTGRLVIDAEGRGVIARIAVLPALRGRGLAERIVLALEQWAAERGVQHLLLRPHDYLEAFYRGLGYETSEGTSRIGSHQLLTMVKTLGPAAEHGCVVRRLAHDDATAYLRLRAGALEDTPLAFASGPDDDRMSHHGAVLEYLERGDDSVIFGAFDDALLGAVGLYRDPHFKARHRAHLWGMYVAPEHRHGGLGASLLQAALQHAGTRPGLERVCLSVSEVAPQARRLYERAGFRVWGTEPDALRHGGTAAAEHHLSLRLRSPRASS